MMQSSVSQALPSSRVARRGQVLGARVVPLGVCLALCGAILAWLAFSSARPYGDSGGYENMLRHFLATGRVDYMKWSQPTFIGLLPVAVPWAWAFGTSTASLQWLSVAFSLALIAGVWAFCRPTVGAWPALWMALGVLLLHEALSSSVAFMTDVPYAAYLVGFLLAHRELEARQIAHRSSTHSSSHTPFEKGTSAPPIGLWLAWGALFLLSALTRSFSLALVPIFFVQWLLARRTPGLNAFALRCLVGGVVLAVLSVVIVRRLGVNAFSPGEITAIPLIASGQVGRFNLRTLLAGVLGMAVAVLPSLLMGSAMGSAAQWRHSARAGQGQGQGRRGVVAWRGVSMWDAMLGVGALGLGLLLWRKGNLNSMVALPQLPQAEAMLNMVQVVLGAVAVPLLARVLGQAVKSALALKPRLFQTSGEEASALGHTSGVLATVALAHFALMPILLHPLPRHLLPAAIAVLLLVALQSASPHATGAAPSSWARAKKGLAAVMTLGLLACITLGVAAQRALSQKQFDVAASINKRGVPVSQLAGGWAFFCARDLKPGQRPSSYLAPNDYVARFTKLEASAPILVTTDSVTTDSATRGKLLSTSRVPLAGPRTVRALRRDFKLPSKPQPARVPALSQTATRR